MRSDCAALQPVSEKVLRKDQEPPRHAKNHRCFWRESFWGIIYRTLKNNWVFKVFPNFVLATPAKA
jgi:hypothetical protein